MQHLWLAKVIKTKEMTENLRTSNNCHFIYMLDFILKPGAKLEYQDNAGTMIKKSFSFFLPSLKAYSLNIQLAKF